MFETRWRMLVILFIARTALGFQIQTIVSAAPFLRDQFGVGFTEIGTLIGLYAARHRPRLAGRISRAPLRRQGALLRWLGTDGARRWSHRAQRELWTGRRWAA